MKLEDGFGRQLRKIIKYKSEKMAFACVLYQTFSLSHSYVEKQKLSKFTFRTKKKKNQQVR